MRALVLTLVLALSLAASMTAAADVGVGVIAGEPTGLSFKWWHEGGTAVDLATGWSISRNDLYVHADYLWHRVIDDEEIGGRVPVYFGVGGRALLRDDVDS